MQITISNYFFCVLLNSRFNKIVRTELLLKICSCLCVRIDLLNNFKFLNQSTVNDPLLVFTEIQLSISI